MTKQMDFFKCPLSGFAGFGFAPCASCQQVEKSRAAVVDIFDDLLGAILYQ